MIKTKRVRRKRNESNEPQSPTALPPKDTSNPFTKWMIGLAVLSLLVIGGPVAIWAQTETPDTSRVSFDTHAFKNFKENFSTLQKSFENLISTEQLVQTINKLKNEVISLKTKQTTVCKEDASRMDCLNVCRKSLAKCNSSAKASAAGALDPCLSTANECINKCNYAPRPSISCDDRCAVALGGCIEKASSGSKSNLGAGLESCRKSNRECLVKACKYEVESKLPTNYCPDQCKRMDEICTSGSAKNNGASLAACNNLKSLCQDKVCTQSSNCTSDQIEECSKIYAQYLETSDKTAAEKMQAVCLDQCMNQTEAPKPAETSKCTAEQEEECQIQYKACASDLKQDDQAGNELCLKTLSVCKLDCSSETQAPPTAPGETQTESGGSGSAASPTSGGGATSAPNPTGVQQ